MAQQTTPASTSSSSQIDKTKQDIKSSLNGAKAQAETTISELSDKVSDLSTRVRDMSANLADESVSLVKNYPFHTAVGAAVVGFIAGAFLIRRR